MCLLLDYGNRCSGLGFLLLDKFFKPNLHPSLVIQLDFHSITSNVSLCSKKRPRLFHPFNYSPSNQWRQLILPCNSLSYLLSISTLTFHFISSSILTIGISLKSLISLLKDFVNIRALSVSIEFGPMYKGICINQYATGLIIYSFDMWFLNSSDIELLHASKMRSSQQTWYFSLKFV